MQDLANIYFFGPPVRVKTACSAATSDSQDPIIVCHAVANALTQAW